MITTAPLPRLGGLLTGGGDAAAPWSPAGYRGFALSRSAWSLAALARLVAERHGRPARVAVPAWFCAASLLPLRATGAELRFVAVDDDGHALWPDDLDADLVVAVHSFGRPAPLDRVRALCDRYGALLVEDAAHALMPVPGIGGVGDAVLFSPHKLLGVPEGAVLAVRPPLAEAVARLLGPLPAAPSPSRWLARRLVQTLLPDALRPRLPLGGQPDLLSDPPPEPPMPATALSPLAARLLAAAPLAAEAQARRRNAAALRAALAGLPGWAPWDDGEFIPYRLVMRCADQQVAAARYACLRAAHLPVETWPDMAPEVAAAPERFGAARALRRTLLLLPVHGGLPTGFARCYAEALDAR